MLWGNLLHLSSNFWEDKPPAYSADLRCDSAVWARVTEAMAAGGLDTVVIDLGDGVQYESHPELAVNGAWTVKRLRQELARLRDMGIEPIPKLNFSATHDIWLGNYSRQVSTDVYYDLCSDLIAEVTELFDSPRLFHLGMDEETASNQREYEYAVVRQGDLWWHDLFFLADQATSNGARPWIWSDYMWHHPNEFFDNMPKTILQSNWYYYYQFASSEADRPRELAGYDRYLSYLDLDEHGYDQVATASAYVTVENIARTVGFCSSRIETDRMKGYLFAQWKPMTPGELDYHLHAIEQIGRVRRDMERGITPPCPTLVTSHG